MRRRLIVTAGFAGSQLRAASRSFSFVFTQDRKRCGCQHRGNAEVRSGRRLEFADSASVTLTAISLDQVFGSADVSRSTAGTLTSRVNSQDLRAVLPPTVPYEAETPYTVGVSPVREAGARPHPGPPRLGRRSPLPATPPLCPRVQAGQPKRFAVASRCDRCRHFLVECGETELFPFMPCS